MARASISTWPGAGTGSGISSTRCSAGGPGLSTRTARTSAVEETVVRAQARIAGGRRVAKGLGHRHRRGDQLAGVGPDLVAEEAAAAEVRVGEGFLHGGDDRAAHVL